MLRKVPFFLLMLVLSQQVFPQGKYTPTWESIDKHATPDWYSDAKFGIFIHWGIPSVPAYDMLENGSAGPNAGWYGPLTQYKPWKNNNYHATHYGEEFSYRDFASLFKAELWNPAEWASIIESSGAKYVVLTAKHHDGYCLWDTKSPYSKGWNSVKSGPERDILKEFSSSLNRYGIRFGVAYSLMEWERTSTSWPFDAQYASERMGFYLPPEIVDKYHLEDSVYRQHITFQIQELVKNYSPDIIYANGSWDHDDTFWGSKELLSWIYNNAPNKRNILVNDLWGKNVNGVYGDFYTSSPELRPDSIQKPWEMNMGLSSSTFYNRLEKLENYKSIDELIKNLCKTISKGGNFLLNISADADGSIPLIQQSILKEIGNWININEKAVFNSKPGDIQGEGYGSTINRNNYYVFLYEWTQGSIKIDLPEEIIIKNCNLLGLDSRLVWKQQGPKLLIFPPVISPDEQNLKYVYVFQLEVEPK